MKFNPFILALTVLTCCVSAASDDEREQNVIRFQATDIDGNIYETVEKKGEYLKVKAKDGLLVLERVQVDGSYSRFEFKGDIKSQKTNGNQQIYMAKSHYSEDTDKFIIFGIDRENNTIDSLYQDYGEDDNMPEARLLKIFGDLRWDGE